MQLLALVLAPLAMVLQVTGGLPKGWQELVMLGGAVCIFCLGRVVESYGRG